MQCPVKTRTLTLFVVVASMAACARSLTLVPFTSQLRAQYELSDDEIKSLQFYLRGDMLLRRERSTDGKEVTPGHSLRIVDGKQVEEVQFEDGVPCVAVAVLPDRVLRSFGPKDTLMLGDPGTDDASTYTPLGRSEDENFYVTLGAEAVCSPQTSYPEEEEAGDFSEEGALLLPAPLACEFVYGEEYVGVDVSAHLVIELDKLKKFEKKGRKVPGQRLARIARRGS